MMANRHSHRQIALPIALFCIAIGFWTRVIVRQSSNETPINHMPAFVIQKLDPNDIRYVAVGDSYTCGTGAMPSQSWPTLLTQELRDKGVKIGLAANLGINGYTTQDALSNEMTSYETAKPTFATLMIGVNDTYRTTTPEEFHTQVVSLMDRMLRILPDKSRMIVVTIPDYSVTPSCAQYADRNVVRHKIGLLNAILKTEAEKRHLPLVDVCPASQQMGKDPSLVASDGLHPSAKEYALWEKLIFPDAEKLLSAPSKS